MIKPIISRYRQVFISFLLTLTKVFRTRYWGLLRYFDLNNHVKEFKVSEVKILNDHDNWKVLEIEGFQFYWPSEYSIEGLKGLYRETFSPYIINPHAYETNKIKISSGDWVLDAGACEGFFIHYALMRNAKVLAVEPMPRLAEALRKTFNKEIADGKVIVLNAGIGTVTGKSQLQENKNKVFCSTVMEGQGLDIPIVSLDDIIIKNIIPTINFLKMDIEGGEIDAFRGAKKTLAKRPKLSIAVYHDYQNAYTLRKIIQSNQPLYSVKYRGLFMRDDFGPPRPYMLHAY